MLTFATRLSFVLAVIIMIYLALTPGPLGVLIERGEDRHLLAFTLLPLMSVVAWPRVSLYGQFSMFAVVGAVIEIAQGVMAIGRAAEIDDFLIDCTAAAVALGLVALVRGSTPDEYSDPACG